MVCKFEVFRELASSNEHSCNSPNSVWFDSDTISEMCQTLIRSELARYSSDTGLSNSFKREMFDPLPNEIQIPKHKQLGKKKKKGSKQYLFYNLLHSHRSLQFDRLVFRRTSLELLSVDHFPEDLLIEING